MNRRSLLQLLPIAALGGLWTKWANAQPTPTVIESSRGTVKILRHLDTYSGNRARDATIEITIDDIGTREQWEKALYGKDGPR